MLLIQTPAHALVPWFIFAKRLVVLVGSISTSSTLAVLTPESAGVRYKVQCDVNGSSFVIVLPSLGASSAMEEGGEGAGISRSLELELGQSKNHQEVLKPAASQVWSAIV